MFNIQKIVRSTGAGESRDTFVGYHPIVNMFYFVAVIGFTMFFTHPVCLALSLICAFSYSTYINGKRAIHFTLIYMLPILLLTAALNPLFNHQGSTILLYFPDAFPWHGNPLTLESILFGLSAAVLLITVIMWFMCFNEVMTSDKFVYLFGRIIPALSLILSMALRFVPRFREQIKIISNAQKCIGRGVANGNIIYKIKHGVRILSILVTWVLENSIETADSMKGRGFGLPGRTAFSIFRFDRRDLYALIYIFSSAAVVIAGAATGAYHFRYFPTIGGQWTGFGTIVIFAAYLVLCLFPLIINIKDDITWKSITSKI